jgi:phosphoglycerate dehydrogenase-like enzyme
MSERLRVLIADFLDEHDVESPILGDVAELELARATGEEQLRERLPHADALILYHDIPMLTDASLAVAGRCRGIVRAGVGFNNVDLEAAGERGIVVCNVPDYGTEEVADHAIMMLLALARGLKASDESMRRGEWEYRSAGPAPRLRGKVLGIVGCGRIGTATALRAKAFGLDVVFYDPLLPDGVDKALGIRRAYRLEDLLAESRFLSLHCYLSPATHHMIDAAALARLPRGAYLINTARGPVVEQEALIAALDSGHLAGAGIDVFEREPLDEPRLRDHPAVLLTPHSAFYSAEGFVELRRKTALEVRRLLLGEPPRNPVNRDRIAHPRTPLA